MIILIGIVFLAGIVLTVYGLFFLKDSDSQRKERKKDFRGSKEFGGESKEQKVSELMGQFDSLRNELERSRSDYLNLQKEMKIASKREADLKEELKKKDEWVGKGEEILKKVKEQNVELEKKLLGKDKEIQIEFAKNVKLNQELSQSNEKLQVLEMKSAQLSEEVEGLNLQIERQSKELDSRGKEMQAQSKAISDFKKSQEESGWISKEEYNKLQEACEELKSQLNSKKKEIETKDKQIEELDAERIRLKNQLLKKDQPQPQIEPDKTEEEKPEEKKPEALPP
ncbi:MAG: hypothetical protein Q8O13_05080 [Candidatus Omnitrophota bacterium]|nr:hypothetical protein [Candidatus Omnitrophota bacterium]